MEVIMKVSEKVIVIASGKKIMEGSPEEVTSHPEVISAYLGGDFHVKN
jgi:ABC-type branched-subunit amino acid transport system ATPase component